MLYNEFTNLSWQGTREKDAKLMQFIIEGTIDDGDVVFDCTGSMGEF